MNGKESPPTPYKAIARKYRPQTFKEVIGQEAIVQTLKNGMRLGRISHAYLFSGCRGTGKTTLARLLAKAVNCLSIKEDFEPCNTCISCTSITAGKSLDVIEIDGASNRGIDDIRQLNETVGYAPAYGRYKIYIIDEVHMLTKEAFNALLKTLEEPPPTVKFFFATTEPHRVPPTISSRCQRFSLSRIPFEKIVEALGAICHDLQMPFEHEALELIARVSEGAMRDAQSLLDQMLCLCSASVDLRSVTDILGFLPQDDFFLLDDAIHSGNLTFAFSFAAKVFSSGRDVSHFLESLQEHFRSHLLLKLGQAADGPNALYREKYGEKGRHHTLEQCLFILDLLVQFGTQGSTSKFKRINLETILIALIKSHNRVPVETLVRRLCELETDVKRSIPVQVPSAQAAVEKIPPKESSPQAVLKPQAPAPEPKAPIVATPTPQVISSEQKAPPQAVLKPQESAPSGNKQTSQKHETLLRFAAVELEGCVKK